MENNQLKFQLINHSKWTIHLPNIIIVIKFKLFVKMNIAIVYYKLITIIIFNYNYYFENEKYAHECITFTSQTLLIK